MVRLIRCIVHAKLRTHCTYDIQEYRCRDFPFATCYVYATISRIGSLDAPIALIVFSTHMREKGSLDRDTSYESSVRFKMLAALVVSN